MKHILFVCTGNTCRSSMAEGLFRAMLERYPELQSRFSVSSAGVSAVDGLPASPHAIKVLNDEWNIDIGSHSSSSLTGKMVDEADYIFTMTRSHKQAILSLFPQAREKLFTLKEYIKDKPADKRSLEYDYTLDIMDPYGGDLNVYRKCASEIRDAIEKLLDKLAAS